MMKELHSIVFLVAAGDTLPENDHTQDDLKNHMDHEIGPECRECFWPIPEELLKHELH